MKLCLKNILQNIINRIESEEDKTLPEEYFKDIIIKLQTIMKLWIARDKDGSLWVYEAKPIKFEEKYFIDIEENSVDTLGAELPEKWFPEVTFENSPRQVELNYVMNGL